MADKYLIVITPNDEFVTIPYEDGYKDIKKGLELFTNETDITLGSLCGGTFADIDFYAYCDDEFLLKDNTDAKVNAYAMLFAHEYTQAVVFGNVVVVKDIGFGESDGFTEEELKDIQNQFDLWVKINNKTIEQIHRDLDGNAPEPYMEFMEVNDIEDLL